MPAVEQVRIILERTFGFPVAESDAQIVLDRLTELARKEAVEQSAHPTSEHSTAAFNNSDLNSDDREDSNPLFFTRG